MTPQFLIVQLLNGLAFGMLLFLLAAGLSLIFGMLDVINLAHGGFYLLGGYLALTIVRATESFWLAFLLVPLAVGLAGALVELGLLRPLYARGHLDQVLLTFGLAFVILDLVKWVWGANVHSLPPPPGLSGALDLGVVTYPKYRAFVIVAGLLIGLLLWLGYERTRLGAIVRAGVADREMVSGLGIDVQRVFTFVFASGVALAALAGVIATPFLSLAPGLDFQTLILSLIVVVIGGLGTLRGSFFGALLVGLADTFGKVLLPELSLVIIFALMAAVLLLRPTGLFGRAVA